MKRLVTASAIVLVGLLIVVSAVAQVSFTVAKTDIETYWKKSWPKETLLEVASAGAGIPSVRLVNLKRVSYYSVPAKVRVKRADGSVANFSVSAIYQKPAVTWIFENVATGNVQQEKVAGQEPPPFAEAEAIIRKGWTDKFSAEGDTQIVIHKVYPDPKFKSYAQRFWYIYRIDVDYRSGNTQYQCRGQEANVGKSNPDSPWLFSGIKNAAVCQGQNLK